MLSNQFDDQDSDDNDESLFGIGFTDILTSYSGILFLMMVLSFSLLLLYKGKADYAFKSNTGDLSVEISWPDERDVDIDLWGRAPDGVSVGYSNPHSQYLDLVRDIVGHYNNPSRKNYELMFGRKLIPGEWTFNASFFGKNTKETETVPVVFTVRIRQKNSPVKVFTSNFTLTSVKQEKTLIDFVLDEQGNVIEDSINSRDRRIVSGQAL